MAEKRVAVNPHYTNNAKNRIECEIHFPESNRKVRAVINKDAAPGKINPDWRWLMSSVGEKKIEENTTAFSRRLQTQESRMKQLKERQDGENLFNLKLEIFELPEVRESKNTKLKSKIRRATTPIQAQTYAAALIAFEAINAEEPAKKPARKKKAPNKVTLVDNVKKDKDE